MKILIQAMTMGFLVGAMFMAGTKAADWAIPDKPRAPLKLQITPDQPPADQSTDDAAERRMEL